MRQQNKLMLSEILVKEYTFGCTIIYLGEGMMFCRSLICFGEGIVFVAI